MYLRVCKFLFLRMRDLGIWDDVRKFYYPVVNGWSVVELFCDPYSHFVHIKWGPVGAIQNLPHDSIATSTIFGHPKFYGFQRTHFISFPGWK